MKVNLINGKITMEVSIVYPVIIMEIRKLEIIWKKRKGKMCLVRIRIGIGRKQGNKLTQKMGMKRLINRLKMDQA